MTSDECQVAGTIGIVVQISLAVLVGFVLLFEYLVEWLQSMCRSRSSARSFRTFWFDSYKICAGALVSHIFNIAVSIVIDALSTGADQCAIYALAFFYEACGVPFVQLLQYGVIQYALRMASNTASVPTQCRTRWRWISAPGIYDANRYPVNDCIHCRSCQDSGTRLTYVKIALVLAVASAASVCAGYVGQRVYASDWFIDVSIAFLALIFLLSTAIAPVSSLWQTFAWVLVKLLEKSIWSLFAMAQASVFADWSKLMSTGDAKWDAWLYIAVIPIIMNAFMFFMFSRISRLKLPCFAPKYTQKIDRMRQEHEVSLERGSSESAAAAPMMDLEQNLNSNAPPSAKEFDRAEAFKVGVVFMLMVNVTLLVIAGGFLGYQGALESIWILFLSMIVAPLICSIVAIYAFAYIINRQIHLCGCCGSGHGNKYNNGDDSRIRGSINKLSISLKG